MKPAKYAKVKFLNKDKSLFFSVLRENIDSYFETNSIEKTGGTKLLFKAFILLSLYLVPFALILTGNFTPLQMLFLTVVMGLGVAGVGMSVMHDAIHGSFSASSKTLKIPSVSTRGGSTRKDQAGPLETGILVWASAGPW